MTPLQRLLRRLNMRRGLVLSAIKQALIFAVLVGLTWSLRAANTAAMIADCPPSFPPQGGDANGPPRGNLPRPFGPHFFSDHYSSDVSRHAMLDPHQGPHGSFGEHAGSVIAPVFLRDFASASSVDIPSSAEAGSSRKPCKHKRSHREGHPEHESRDVEGGHKHHNHNHHHHHSDEHKDKKMRNGDDHHHHHEGKHKHHHGKKGNHVEQGLTGALIHDMCLYPSRCPMLIDAKHD